MAGEDLRVAFIGLGKMGAAIAGNILKAGFDLTVYNRTPSKMEPLLNLGAKGSRSPKEAVMEADVVLTCMPNDALVLDTLIREDGILAGLKPGGIHIATETIAPKSATQFAELHAEHGSIYIAEPVIGRPVSAEAGELLTFVAGDPEAIEKCKSLMEAYSIRIHNMGEVHSAANSMKLAMNFMVLSHIELIGETYAFAEKSGIDLELMGEMMLVSFGHPAIKEYTKRIRARNFDEAAFELITGFKDVSLIMQASTDNQTPLPYISIIWQKFLTAIAQGLEFRDWSATYEVTRKHAGLK